jgi:hypothetical protein
VKLPVNGAIDCDVHIALPNTAVLLPHMDEYWREHITQRGLDQDNLDSSAYPANAPITGRPDWRGTKPGTDLRLLQSCLDTFGTKYAICNVLHGSPLMFSEDLSAAFCRAINNWVAKEWLDRDPRLRASITVPIHSPDLAAAEIERCAADPRFVQVLLLASAELPLGRRINWPIYAAAERNNLPIGVHAGSSYRHAPTNTGWPSYFLEDYVGLASGCASALNSLICEGVFVQYPNLKVVLMESGVTWLPNFIWRAIKTWRGVRAEVPWVDRSPADIVREHFRLTIQPFDAPADAETVQRLIEQIDCDDMLLFASDYPHWQFDGPEPLPPGLSRDLIRKITRDNPLATYPRLKETVQ